MAFWPSRCEAYKIYMVDNPGAEGHFSQGFSRGLEARLHKRDCDLSEVSGLQGLRDPAPWGLDGFLAKQVRSRFLGNRGLLGVRITCF